MSRLRILFAGGGSGGHLVPALALAEALSERGDEFFFVHGDREIERPFLAPFAEGRSHALPVSSSSIGFVFSLRAKKREAQGVLRSFRPQVVVGLGGRTSYPVLEAAKSLGIPVLLLEQNRVMGRANRKFSRSAARICHAFPLLGQARLPSLRWTGLPLRRHLMRLRGGEEISDLSIPDEELVLLVLGGSQGAEVLNLHLPLLLARLGPELRERLHVIHVAGPGKEGACFKAYQGTGLRVHVFPFREDVPSLLRRADLCVLRGGGTTLCEAAALGKGMLVVPIPWHPDKHQVKNAAFLAEQGAAELLSQEELLRGEGLERIEGLLLDKERREGMGAQARDALPRDGTERVLVELEALARRGALLPRGGRLEEKENEAVRP